MDAFLPDYLISAITKVDVLSMTACLSHLAAGNGNIDNILSCF